MFSSLRSRGVAVFATTALIFVPLIVLGWSIGWPASLGDPAEVTLPRLLDNEVAVRLGYLVYLAYSALFFPIAVVVTEWLGSRTTTITETTISETRATAMKIAIGMAAVSSALRCIGIVRWLTTMFPLAERWDAATTDTEREALAIQFQTINDFGGSIGELLGVSLFASLWLAFTAAAVWRSAPNSFAISAAFVASLLTLPLVELAGIDSGPLVSVSSTAITLWLWAVAVAMIRAGRTR
jgi:hypothetical protein